MGYYEDIYKKRVNRFGTDMQSRLQGQREYAFENYLNTSVYRIDFKYNNIIYPGTFEPYKQDETEILHYLLTKRDLLIPNGTLIKICHKNDLNKNLWMVYWMEELDASGYNRYVMLKMTHLIKFFDRDRIIREFWAYLYGQEDNMLKDELKSRSRSHVLYNENLKLNFLITPINQYINKEDYFVIHNIFNEGQIDEKDLKQGFRVTGYDTISTPGVEYISVDPMYLKDETPPPIPHEGDDENDFFWIKSGE